MLGRRKTIGFWAGDQNNFQFIDPLIDSLSNYYKVKRFEFNGNTDRLLEQMRSVDLAWMEWGQGPVGPASNFDKFIPIINRIHRYETYTDAPNFFNYKNIDALIFISPSVELKFREKFPDKYNDTNPQVIPIGVDQDLFKFMEKEITKKIIYVGRIHPHKNPSLLLQIMAKLVKEDPEYNLTAIGRFDDELYEEYFFDQCHKLGISDYVEHLDFMPQENLVKHYQESDFFIISSIIEGYSQACAEAMACGARPVVCAYKGSELVYPRDCLYSTVDEAVDLIRNPRMDRNQVRHLIDKDYLLKDKSSQVKDLIDKLLS